VCPAALQPSHHRSDTRPPASPQVIYDLLVRASPPLELREDPEAGVTVAGLSRNTVASAAEIMALLQEGNTRRKTESTDANAVSSRSHAVRRPAAAACLAGGGQGAPPLSG
jgi:hypothetical protein